MARRSDQICRRTFRCRVVFALLVFSAAAAMGGEQSPSPILKEYRQRVWTKEDGLPDNSIRSVLQTRDGYLWIGTSSGLARFDGQKFTVFNHENSPIPTHEARMIMAEQDDGGLWIGTSKGLLFYKEGSFTRYTMGDGLWSDDVITLHIGSSGKLWIGTGAGPNLFENGSIKRLPSVDWTVVPGQTVYGFFEETPDLVWILSESMVHKREVSTRRFEQVLHEGERFDPVSIHSDPQGRIWIGDSMQLFQSENGRWIRHPLPNDRAWGTVTSILTDQAGSMWFSMSVRGLGRYHDGKFTFYDRSDGLPDDWIVRIHEDRAGNLWLATGNAGLVCWQPRRFTTYTRQDGLPDDDVRTVFAASDGSVWIGTEGGLGRFRDGEFTSHKRETGPQNTIRSIAQDATGALWLGTLGAGVSCLRDGRFTDYRLPGKHRYSNTVRSLAIGSDDSVWIGTGRGLHRLSNGTLTGFDATNAVLDKEIWALHQDGVGNLWIGGLGAVRISAAGLNEPAVEHVASSATAQLRRITIPPSEVSVFATTNGLSNDNIWALHEDTEGAIWVGTAIGLNRIKDGRISMFTKREGLPDERIEEILEDYLGNFWIAWERGIFRVAKSELNDVAEGRGSILRCVAYDESDTLPNARINGRKSHPAGCKTRDGRLWLPTTKGVVVFDPKKVIERDSPPPVILESVRANGRVVFGDLDAEGKPVVNGQKSVVSGQSADSGAHVSASSAGLSSQSQIANRKSQIRLPAANARVMEFDYTACDFVGGDTARFKYRLEGFDKDWVDAGTRRRAFYSNLRPGNYRFQVIACNHNGIWNEMGALLAFYLAPQFYQTKAFFALSGLAIGLACWGLHQVRVRVLKRIHDLEHQKSMAQERARIAQDIHDDLGARLTQIDLLTELAKRDLNPDNGAAEHVRKIAARSQEISQSVDEIVWALNVKNDNLRSLLAYIRACVQEFLSDSGLQVRFDWPEILPDVHVKAEVRHNLFLVIREALHNVLQHAGAKEVLIRISLHGSALCVEVADDGCGFTTATVGESGNGLRNMERRVASLRGRFQIESRAGAGTTIRLSVDLPDETNVCSNEPRQRDITC